MQQQAEDLVEWSDSWAMDRTASDSLLFRLDSIALMTKEVSWTEMAKDAS